MHRSRQQETQTKQGDPGFAPGILLPLLILLLSVLYYSSFYHHGLVNNDEGHLLSLAERVYEGDVPGRDFHLETYIYGRYLFLGFLFRIFGEPHILIERGLWVVMRSLCVLMSFLLARRLMPLSFALPSALFLMILPGPWFKTPYPFFCLLGLWCLFLFIERRSGYRLALAGLAGGIGLQFRQDVGLIVLAVTSVMLPLTAWKDRIAVSGRHGLRAFFSRTAKWLSVYYAFTAIAMAPAAAYLLSENALVPVFQQCFVEKFKQHLGLFNFLSKLESMWNEGDQVGCLYFLIPPVVFLCTMVVLLERGRARQVNRDYLELLALSLVAALSINQAYNFTLVIRLLQCLPPTLILAAFLSWRAGDRAQNHMHRWAGVSIPVARYGIAALFGLLLLLWGAEIMTSDRGEDFGDEYVAYLGSFATYSPQNVPLDSPRAGIRVPPKQAKLLNDTVAGLQSATSPDEPIFIASNDSILYFLSDRKNSSRYTMFLMPETIDRLLCMADDLESDPPNHVVTNSPVFYGGHAHPVVEFIVRHYVIEKEIGTKEDDFLILERR